MSSLSDFAGALLPDGAATPTGLVAWNGSDPSRRFAVYRNNVMSSLLRALEDAFPVCAKLVGTDFFRAMAVGYVRAEPPRTPVLAEHGAGFAGFVDRFQPAAGVPYLGDMARLERARLEAFHAADAPALSPRDFEPWLAMPEGLMRQRVELHPSLRLLPASRSVLALWQAHLADGPGALAAARECAEGPNREDLLVRRPGAEVEAMVLPAGACTALSLLASGATIAETLEAAADAPGFSLPPILAVLVHGRVATRILP
jgi:hypothetical protein